LLDDGASFAPAFHKGCDVFDEQHKLNGSCHSLTRGKFQNLNQKLVQKEILPVLSDLLGQRLWLAEGGGIDETRGNNEQMPHLLVGIAAGLAPPAARAVSQIAAALDEHELNVKAIAAMLFRKSAHCSTMSCAADFGDSVCSLDM